MTRAKFDIEKFNGTGDFGLWRIKMRVLLIQHRCEATLEVLPADMEAQMKAELNKKAHNAMILCLGNKVLREVTGETTATGVWSKLETLYMTKSLANKLYLKKKLYTFYMPTGRKIFEHIDEFNKIVLDLANIEIALTLEDVMATLNSKKIKERSKTRGMMVKGYIRAKSRRLMVPGLFYPEYEGIIAYTPWMAMQWGCVYCSCKEKDSLCVRVWHKERTYGEADTGAGIICIKRAVWQEKSRKALYSGVIGTIFIPEYGSVSGESWEKLWMDNGLEFYNQEFELLCIESGIARHLTVAGTPQQNGVAERMNKTLMDKVRYLLIQSRLPKTFWAEATCTAAYLINTSPSRAIEKKTPMEMWSGHPSDYEMLRIFCCVAYLHDKQDYQLARDRERRTRTKPLRFQDESNMAAYAFTAAEEEDTHEPLTYQEAVACEDSSKWKAAMEEEMDSLRKNKTWELVDHLAGQKLVSCIWQFKIKEGIEGVQKPRYKARLVARGFTQRAGIDYNEVFSPVVRHISIQVILALTACKDYELEHLDVKTAFLNGNLEEVIYMKQPPGYEQGNKLVYQVFFKKEFDMKELGEAKEDSGYGDRQGLESQDFEGVTIRGAIHLSRNHVFHKRTKHINVRYHFIKEVLEAKTVKVMKVGTEHNATDALTKVGVYPTSGIRARFREAESYNLEEAITRRTNTLCLVRHILHSGGRIDIVDSLTVGSSSILEWRMQVNVTSFSIPIFDGKMDFTVWKMTIEDVLVQQGIDEALEEKQPVEMKDDVWKTMQKNASSTIRLALAPEIKYSVLKEKTPKDIWDKLTNIYASKSLTHRLFLKMELYSLKLEEGNNPHDHINSFNQPWRTTLTFEDVLKALRDKERMTGNDSSSSSDKLLLTDDSGRGRNFQRGSSKGRSKSRMGGNRDMSVVECYYCGDKGHMQVRCPQFREDLKSLRDSKGKKKVDGGEMNVVDNFGR
ncbi:retrovirus-related pol polyprotein from transposon TNT 1-94 [Tanacetum coccineum]